MKKIILCGILMCAVLFAANVWDGDVVTEEDQITQPVITTLPKDFDFNTAQAELKAARLDGDRVRVKELSQQITTWWLQNRVEQHYDESHGFNVNPGPNPHPESYKPGGGASINWGNDVQIDPNDDLRPVKIASTSTGELYAFSVWYDGSQYHIYLRRSINNGETWSTYYDAAFASTTTILNPGILIANDTIIYYYILYHPSVPEWRTWAKVTLPGATEQLIYYGSPTGSFNPEQYTSYHMASDAVIYSDAYLYAAVTEQYGSGPDSTVVKTITSQDLDVSSWEVGPLRLDYSSGANIYFTGNRLAFGSGSDRMWLINWLHPAAYPNTYDRTVKGYYSDNYGSTWSSRITITPNNNHLDEFEPAVAAAHTNSNWMILCTQSDTADYSNKDIRRVYSTDDGSSWTDFGWIATADNYLPDVWVDFGSTAFYGVSRQDATSGDEFVRYKDAPIDNPAGGPASVDINDDPNENLSAAYGPAITYNEGMGEPCVAWNSYEGGVYTIWFDTYSGVGVGEQPDKEKHLQILNLTPNPTQSSAKLSYQVHQKGDVAISMFDATGRLVRSLINEHKDAGVHSLVINNADLAAGIYFVHVETADGSSGKALTIIR